MINKTQNIPIPYTQIVLSRAQENWKERKVQILFGAGLSILGLALIPIIGPFSAIICSLGLAVLGHGFFRDPKHSPSLLPRNTTPLQRIDTTPKRVAEKMFEAFCKKPFDPLTATQEEKEIHDIFQAIAKNNSESLASKLGAFKDRYPEKYPVVWTAARELSKLLKRQETTLSQFDPASRQPEKSSRAALAIGSVLGGVFLYGINHLLRKANNPNASEIPQNREASSPPSGPTSKKEEKPTVPPTNREVPLKPKKPTCSWPHSSLIDMLTSQVPQENGKIVSGIGGSTPIRPLEGTGFSSPGPVTYGFTLSDVRSLLGKLHEKKIPLSLAPFIRALLSLLNDDSLSSNPLILVSLDHTQIDHLQSLLGKDPSLISDGVSSLSVKEINPAKTEMPITEVIIFCKLQDCQDLLFLLQDSDDPHLLSGSSGSETGLAINMLYDPNQISFIRITKEKFRELLEKKTDLLFLLLKGYGALSLPDSSLTTNLNGEDFLQIADRLKGENEDTKAKNNELGARLLAIESKKKPQIPEATSILASEKIAQSMKSSSDAFSSDGHRIFGLTLSDLESIFVLLHGKKIPTSLVPFIHALRSQLNDSLQSPSSNPLILIPFHQSQTDALQSLLENKPLSLLQSDEDAERVSSVTVIRANPEQNEKPITEVVILCNPKDCEVLLILLEEDVHSHLLASDIETGLILNSLADDPNQLSIIRITRERFLQLLEKHPDLLSLLQGDHGAPLRPKSAPSMSMNGEGFLQLADMFSINNENTKAKNKDLGARLLAIASEIPQQFSTTNAKASDLSTFLPEDLGSKNPSIEEGLDGDYYKQIAESLKSKNEKTKAKNEELGSRLFAIASEITQPFSTPNPFTLELSTPSKMDIASPHLEPNSENTDQPLVSGTKVQTANFFVDLVNENHLPLVGEVSQTIHPSLRNEARYPSEATEPRMEQSLYSDREAPLPNAWETRKIDLIKPQPALLKEKAPSDIDALITLTQDNPTTLPSLSSKDSQFLEFLNPVHFKQPICELSENVFLEALTNKSNLPLPTVVSAASDLPFWSTQIPTTMMAAIITTLVAAPLIFPMLSHYFSHTSTPPALFNIAHPMAVLIEEGLPLAVEEESVKCNGVSKLVLAVVTSLGIMSYFYSSNNKTSKENEISENNKDDVYSIYIDPKSNSQWKDKTLTLYSPDGTESQHISVVQPNQAKDPISVGAASSWPQMKTLGSQIIKGLLDIGTTAIKMGITHIQNQPGELRRERMIYQTISIPLDLITERVLKKTEKIIDQTRMFLWEAGQPIVNNIVIPFATHSYAFSKAFTLILFDWLKTAIVLFAEQAKEFIDWASTPSPDPQPILEKKMTQTLFFGNEIAITADANRINLNNGNSVDSKPNLLWNKKNEICFEDKNNSLSRNTHTELVQNNLNPMELSKETVEILSPNEAAIIKSQGAGEEENSEKKPTLLKTDSSDSFDVRSQALISEEIVDANENPSDKTNDADTEIDYIDLAKKYEQTNIEIKEKNKKMMEESNLEIILDNETASEKSLVKNLNEIDEIPALNIELEQNNNEATETNNQGEEEQDYAALDTETTSGILPTNDDTEIYEDSEYEYFLNLANKFKKTNSELKERNEEVMAEGLLG